MAELGKKYFLAPATIENIIYGRYERRREKQLNQLHHKADQNQTNSTLS
jgi:hypothetical protein